MVKGVRTQTRHRSPETFLPKREPPINMPRPEWQVLGTDNLLRKRFK